MQALNFLKKADFLGPQINFKIRKDENFKTIMGASFSILIAISYLIFFIIFGKDLIYKENPNVVLQETAPTVTKNFTITQDNFILAFRLEDEEGYEILDYKEHLFFLPQYIRYDFRTNETKRRLIENNRCSETYYKIKFDKNIEFNASDWNCVDFSSHKDLLMGGRWDMEFFAFVNLEIDYCEFNSDLTAKENCKDLNDLKNYLFKKRVFLTTLTYEVIANPSNYTEPLITRLMYSSNILSFNLLKFDVFHFKNIDFEQDTGFIFPRMQHVSDNIGYSRYDKFDEFKSDEQMMQKKLSIYDKNIYSGFYTFEDKFITYTRSYVKIQDVLGNVNGFMQLFVFLIYVFNSLHANCRLDYFLVNQCVLVCDFNEDEQENIINRGSGNCINSRMNAFDDRKIKGEEKSDKDLNLGKIKNIEGKYENKVKRTVSIKGYDNDAKANYKKDEKHLNFDSKGLDKIVLRKDKLVKNVSIVLEDSKNQKSPKNLSKQASYNEFNANENVNDDFTKMVNFTDHKDSFRSGVIEMAKINNKLSKLTFRKSRLNKFEKDDSSEFPNSFRKLKEMQEISVNNQATGIYGLQTENRSDNKTIIQNNNSSAKSLSRIKILGLLKNKNIKFNHINDKNEIQMKSKNSNFVNGSEYRMNKNNNNRAEMSRKTISRLEIINKSKGRFLKPNLFEYYLGNICLNCVSKKIGNRKNTFNFLQKFIEKINGKIDIMYYLHLIKKVKELSHQVFQTNEEKSNFDFLAENLYIINKEQLNSEEFYLEKTKKDKYKILIDCLRDSFILNVANTKSIKEKFIDRINKI